MGADRCLSSLHLADLIAHPVMDICASASTTSNDELYLKKYVYIVTVCMCYSCAHGPMK